jgi:hypothetical protein
MSTKVVTKKVRFSYANVWTPTAVEEGQEKKYNTSILIPKTDTVTIEKIEKAIETELEILKGKNNGKLPKKYHNPLKDGDEEYPEDENYHGMMYLRAASKTQPGIVDKDTEPILNQDEFYSGCWGRASLNFYVFNLDMNKGVGVGLNHVQKLEDGEHLGGGRASAEDDFSDEDDDLI